ncbi:MAG TPA: hypothetical protein VF532_09765 [Candidatus Angelobacter sp.]
MQDDELKRILQEEEILPSSGFTASVMDAVRREAQAPAPIPFPWARALPGMVVAGLTLVAVLVFSAVQLTGDAATTPVPPGWTASVDSISQTAMRMGAPWAILALVVSLASMKFAKVFSGR